MNLEFQARLKLCYGETFSKVLARSLSPDDIPPTGFTIHGYVDDSCFMYEVKCAKCVGEDLLTLRSILSEVILMSLMVRRISVETETKSF